MSLEACHQLAHYEILELMGKGGMGEVYRARDGKLGRDVAIKVLPEEFSRDKERLDRFQREARLLAKLNHTNIATLHGLEEHEGQRFIVMELVEGETLQERIAKGPIPVDEAVALFIQIADGLEAAHEKGVIHRDLKPSNIKIGPDGQIKIMDFGLAKGFVGEDPSAADSSQAPTLTRGTQVGVIMGTAAYMSPEQAKGKPVDKRTDVWAFGCCLYEALTGRKVFYGETVGDVIAAVLRAGIDWSALERNTPAPVERLVRRCLQRDRTRRLRDVGDARIELFELPEESDEAVEGGDSKKRLVVPWLATTLLAVVAGGAGSFLWNFGEPPLTRTPARFSITIPADERIEGHFTNPVAISPDGSRFAFAASKDGQAPRLYFRSQNAFEPRIVPGTRGAAAPFFSPDGNWVAFFADRQLKRVPFEGGTPLVICEFPGGHVGGSWGPNDTIVFADAQRGGLFRVGAGGGKPEALTDPDSGKGEPIHGWPQILPDGKTVLFALETGEGAVNALLSLDTGDWQPILEQEELRAVARYAPSGHLLLAPSGELIAIPFDLERLEVTGAPRPVLENVSTSVTNVAWFAVSDTGTLAFASGTRERNRLLWVDRQG